MLVVDPWHWLNEDGSLPTHKPRVHRRMLRIARLIEYGGPLSRNETRGTLIECKRRVDGKPCGGLLWVSKTEHDGILAHCSVCRAEEAFILNWQKTAWAEGMMPSVRLGGTLH